MLVLGFDTATPAVSVAVHDGVRVVGEAFAVDARRHGELLAPMIAKVMADAGAARADLTAVAVGVGPGPYTGLRVGVVTARVLGAVLGIPVYGVCTLDLIAVAVPATPAGRVPGGHRCAPQRGLLGQVRRAIGDAWKVPWLVAASSIPGAPELTVAGTGGQLYPEAFGAVERARLSAGPHALRDRGGPARRAGRPSRAELGTKPGPGTLAEAGTPLLAAEPLYLRRPDAREPGPPKRVTPS